LIRSVQQALFRYRDIQDNSWRQKTPKTLARTVVGANVGFIMGVWKVLQFYNLGDNKAAMRDL